MEAVAQGDDCAALLAQAHRTDMLGHAPALDPLAARVAALDQLAVAVDPVEPLLLHVPQGAFAEVVPGIDQQLDPQHVVLIRAAVGAGQQPRLVDHGAGMAAMADPAARVERLDLKQVQLAFEHRGSGLG